MLGVHVGGSGGGLLLRQTSWDARRLRVPSVLIATPVRAEPRQLTPGRVAHCRAEGVASVNFVGLRQIFVADRDPACRTRVVLPIGGRVPLRRYTRASRCVLVNSLPVAPHPLARLGIRLAGRLVPTNQVRQHQHHSTRWKLDRPE